MNNIIYKKLTKKYNQKIVKSMDILKIVKLIVILIEVGYFALTSYFAYKLTNVVFYFGFGLDTLLVIYSIFTFLVWLNNYSIGKYMSNFTKKAVSNSLLYYNFLYSSIFLRLLYKLYIINFKSCTLIVLYYISYIYPTILIFGYFFYSLKKKEIQIPEILICSMLYMSFLDGEKWQIMALIIAAINVILSKDYFWYIYKNNKSKYLNNELINEDYINFHISKAKILVQIVNLSVYIIITITQSPGFKIISENIFNNNLSNMDFIYIKAFARILLFTIVGAALKLIDIHKGEQIRIFIKEYIIKKVERKSE